MSESERAKWLTALTRFGLGGKGAAPPPTGDPRAALEAELGKPGAGRIDVPWLASSQATLVSFYDYNARQNDVRARNEAMRSIGAAMPTASAAAAMIPAANMLPAPPPPNRVAETFDSESLARMQAAVEAPVGYVERLVAFWSNHFCISASKGGNVRILAGAFEREAIRPYVLGKFADMLKAVESHPAMLHYLDNSQSVGPDSPNGRSTKRGLNENLAREIMELHTLGANGGYAQADVTEFARALTGWTVIGPEGRLGPPGAFVFNVNAHEGGTRPLLGHEYEDGGYGQGRAMLDDLARAPATARHIASKFARAFVADDPPAPLVARLADTFAKTDGDLGALARALIADDLAWSAPAKKLRDPWELTMSAMRALNLDPHPPQRFLRLLNLMGQPLWAPAGPNGFPTDTAAWASPVGVKARLEIAAALGKLAHDAPAPKDLLERALPGASEETREAVSRAESRAQAYALLIMAPGIPEEMSMAFPHPSRREAVAGAAAMFAAAALPKWASASQRDPRLVVIVLRGALDGLSAVGPLGDPDYADLHRELALTRDGPHAALPLDGFFGLNPAMKNFGRLYGSKQALVLHAAATNYRERSHFDGQDVLESGMPGPGRVESGWLNRAIAALPVAGRAKGYALAAGYTPPLVIRGPAPLLGWAPADLPAPDDGLIARVSKLYAARDADLARALGAGLDAERMASADGKAPVKAGGDVVEQMRKTAAGAARLMAAPEGPRVAALAFDGWDTHVQEGGATGRLANLLGGLDDAIATFETGLGPAWRETVVVAVTEFGRTAHVNGDSGCDHGTGTVAFLAGGAVAGGRVVADWPGLKPAQLYENRDLKPTTDLRAALKGVLADHLGFTGARLAASVFPETADVAPMKGLIV